MFFSGINKVIVSLASICISTTFAQSGTDCVFYHSGVGEQYNSTSSTIVYGNGAPIEVPCLGTSFKLDFYIDDTVNALFSISPSKDPNSSLAIVGRAGGKSGDWQFSSSLDSPISIPNSSSGSALVSVSFESNGVQLLRNGEIIATVASQDLRLSSFNLSDGYYIFFSSESPGITVSSFKISCFGGNGCPDYLPSIDQPEVSLDSTNSPDVASNSNFKSNGEVTTVDCSETSSIDPFYIDSRHKPRNYNLDAPLLIPCSSSSFSASFQVNSDSDIGIAFTDDGGLYNGNKSFEAQIGLFSGISYARLGFYTNKRSEKRQVSKRYVASSIGITFFNSELKIFRDGAIVIKYLLKDFDISKIFISPNSGILYVYGGSITCSSADFCRVNPPIPCSVVRLLPDQTYVSTTAKVYNSTNSFNYGCHGTDFSFSADVTATSDLYVFIATAGGFSDVFSEIRYGIQSGVNVVNYVSNFISASSLNAQTGPAKSVSIGFRYVGGTLSMTINGSQVGSRVFGNWAPIRFNVSPLNGYAILTNRQFTCLNQIQGC
ncbi:hypothetical protein AYI68_g4075 [Smittium mucronatum]|uniref:Uncharacterized protein n=1 Tax=Smittium mucronatum TaxID=133383 RepID=A0A1R0GY98_9FUNG|nr:hypothetical protein AYI68_g4075 [Smittium mucronatum]